MVTTHLDDEDPADEVTTIGRLSDGVANTYRKINKPMFPIRQRAFTAIDFAITIVLALIVALAPSPWNVLGLVMLWLLILRA